MARRWIGTSGWNYKHWADGVFYPPGLPTSKWLDFYARHFNTVELNVTFYRQVMKETFQMWRRTTPEGFAFVAKGSRYITHIKRLKVDRKSTGMFFRSAHGLSGKLSAILWQLPPRFKKDLPRLERFLRLSRDPRSRRAFEFRDPSWFDAEVHDLLREHRAALCIATGGPAPPPVKVITADFLYLRFHGIEKYDGDYPESHLRRWAEFVHQHRRLDLYAYFNNDGHGYAVKNARRFREILEERSGGGRRARAAAGVAVPAGGSPHNSGDESGD
jgi:uncharacterized protein YecE (DUF72 family)